VRIAGDGGRTTLPFPTHPMSPVAAQQLDATNRTNRKDGLVFSLGLSYGRGRATSALGATPSGLMRRISREA